jgi:hypothetical protein
LARFHRSTPAARGWRTKKTTTLQPILEDARLQLIAGIALLNISRLVQWPARGTQFTSTTHADFEGYSVPDLDEHFGRLMRWQMFAAGAEFIAKGVCLANGLEIRRPHKSLGYPPTQGSKQQVRAWLKQAATNPIKIPPLHSVHFGQLGGLVDPTIDKKTGKVTEQAKFDLLLPLLKKAPTLDQRHQLYAAYRVLTRTIRNRDAHAYHPHVRDGHFWMVDEVFIPAFDLLVSWLPPLDGTAGGAELLSHWRDSIGAFLDALKKP